MPLPLTLHQLLMLVIVPQTLDHLEYPDDEEEDTTINQFQFLKEELILHFFCTLHTEQNINDSMKFWGVQNLIVDLYDKITEIPFIAF